MLELYLSGGPVMHFLLFCSLLSLAFIIERLITLHRVPSPEKAEEELERIEEIVKNGGKKQAAEVCAKGKGVLNYIFAALLKRHDTLVMEERSPEDIRTELAIAGDEAGRRYLGRFLHVLATIGVIAPLLGLLGTIIGMIVAFNVIARAGTGDPQMVAGGISQALLTTAFGLIIAIPTIVFHRYLSARAENVLARLELYYLAFINTLMRAA